MTGNSLVRSFLVLALVALLLGLMGGSAHAANYYLDQNGATAGDGIGLGGPGVTYTWSTTVLSWGTAAAGTTTPVAWNNGNTAYFGGMTGDVAGWNYTISPDNTVDKLTGGINVGNVSAGTVTIVQGFDTNFYFNGANTWTVNTGSSLICAGNLSLNMNTQNLTLTGGGNVTFAPYSRGFWHTGSSVIDNLTGVMTVSNTAQGGEFDWGGGTSSFTVNSGTLAFGIATAMSNARFVIGSTNSLTPTLANVSAGPLTLSSTGPVAINSSFTFAGSNNLSFGSGTVGLGTTPTITVLSNTLTFPQPISGPFGINMVGPGTLALGAANTYSGATTVSNGTLALGAAGTLGSGNITIQPGSTLDTSAYGPAGYSINGGVLTAGGTSGVGTDVNGTLNVNNATVNVAGNNNVGTMTVNGGLGLSGGTLAYDGGDQISLALAGALTLSNTTYVVPNAALNPGAYTLFSNYTGISGGSANLSMGGALGSNPRQTFAFDFSSGTSVVLDVSGSAGNLQWTGGTNNTWDTSTLQTPMSQSWFNVSTGSADVFYTGDNTTFTDTPGTATTVNINGTVLPGSVTFSNAAVNYTLSGTGSIGGTTSLLINGQGAVTITNSNSYTGGTNPRQRRAHHQQSKRHWRRPADHQWRID